MTILFVYSMYSRLPHEKYLKVKCIHFLFRLAEEFTMRAAGAFQTRSEKIECQNVLLKLLTDLQKIDDIFVETKLIVDLNDQLVLRSKQDNCHAGERVVTPNLIRSFSTTFKKIPAMVMGVSNSNDDVTPIAGVANLLDTVLFQCRRIWTDGWSPYVRKNSVKVLVQTIMKIIEHDEQKLGTDGQVVWELARAMESGIVYDNDYLHVPESDPDD